MTERRQWWVILGADGAIRGQACTNGATPRRDTPEDCRAVKADRRGDLLHETFDVEAGKWRKSAARRRQADRQLADARERGDARLYRVLSAFAAARDLPPISAEEKADWFPRLLD